MKSRTHPFMGTHVANIALNRDLGLLFLHAEQQNTFGLTEVSGESLINDQLQVAAWILKALMFDLPEDYEGYASQVDPWVRIAPYVPGEGAIFIGMEELEQYEVVVLRILSDLLDLGEDPWSVMESGGEMFLTKLVEQIEQCVAYTNQRTKLILLCATLADMAEASDMELLEVLMSNVTPEVAQKMIETFGIVGGIRSVGAMGYLQIKNAIVGPRNFAHAIRGIVLNVITEKAIEQGYTCPSNA